MDVQLKAWLFVWCKFNGCVFSCARF